METNWDAYNRDFIWVQLKYIYYIHILLPIAPDQFNCILFQFEVQIHNRRHSHSKASPIFSMTKLCCCCFYLGEKEGTFKNFLGSPGPPLESLPAESVVKALLRYSIAQTLPNRGLLWPHSWCMGTLGLYPAMLSGSMAASCDTRGWPCCARDQILLGHMPWAQTTMLFPGPNIFLWISSSLNKF